MTFDANDPEAKAAIDAAVEAAVSEATKGLKAKNDELLGKLKDAKKGQEIDPSTVEKLEAEVERLSGENSTLNKSLKKVTEDGAKLQKSLEAETGFTHKLLADNGLTSALVDAGVKKEFLPAVKALLASQVKVVTEGDARRAMVGDKELSAHIKEWSQSDEGKNFIAAPANNGGGSQGDGKGGGQGSKVITRAEHATMTPAARTAHFKAGGTMVDA